MATLVDKEARLEDRYVAAFAMHEGHTLNGSNAEVHRIRREAIGHFERLGFPARKAEAWKYTPITRSIKREYAFGGGSDAAPAFEHLRVPGMAAFEIVLVNGQFREDLSSLGGLPEGVVVTGFARAAEAHADLVNLHFARYADYEREAFTALNTAFAHDGVFVYVPKNTVVERPIHVISVVAAETDTIIQPRQLFVAERGSQATFVETSEATGAGHVFVNAVTEVFVGENAHVDRYEIQDEHARHILVNTVQAYQEASSVFRTSSFSLSGELIRNNVTIRPDAEGCESHLYGLFLGEGTMHVDNHTLVDHAMPNCFSNELYKGVLDDKSTGVFNGKVLVREDAQQTNAYQSNKSILLTETAQMYAKPELEIYADDVRCSHGATTGQLDADAIFYLRSRGLTEAESRALMLTAFARDVLENIRLEPLRAFLDEQVSARFAG